MLRWKDFKAEVAEVQKKGDKATIADVVKLVDLVGKMARDIRGNQIRIMKAQNIPLSEPKGKGGEGETTTR